MSKRPSKVSALLLILLIVIIAGLAFLYFRYAPCIKTGCFWTSKTSITFDRPEKVCNMYGVFETNVLGDLLDTYTVKRGDTLISIANNVLHNPDSVTDLLSLNKDRYPMLEKGLIEVGWKLYLPNKDLKNYSSMWKGSGNLTLIGTDKFGIKSQTDYIVGAQEISANIANSLTNIKDGDCIVVYFGNTSGWNSEAYLIKPQ